MSHCRETEWDGADCSLKYSASLSEVSCFTVLWISVSVSTAPAAKPAPGPSSTSFESDILQPEEGRSSRHPLSKCSKIHQIVHKEMCLQSQQNSTDKAALPALEVCIPTCAISDLK